MAETAFKHPATICRVTPFLAEFALESVPGGLLSPVYIFLNDNFFGTVFVGREVDNSNSGISNMIWSVSDWVVV